jgi:septal ring factor EnvC (AmiA/AmiB activator)
MLSRNSIQTSAMLLVSYAFVCTSYGALAADEKVASGLKTTDQMSKRDLEDKESAKNANIKEAQALNGERGDAAKEQEKTKAKETADVVNQVPGVKVDSKDLEPPTQPPIKGFHPIKRLLRPVENLEGMSIKLEQQIMKLTGPISALQPPMISLQGKMNSVDKQLGSMQEQLTSTQTEVKGVRSDIAGMRKDIQELKAPLTSLQKPIAGVSKPLEEVQQQLNIVIMAIFVAAIATAIGTPVAAVVLWKYREKLFPGISHEIPKAPPTNPPAKELASTVNR